MKRLGHAAALVFLMFICMSFFNVKAHADTALCEDTQTYTGKKIVSMVYDDSGSMTGEKNAYCNYTIQLFLSLFSEKDSLYVTFLSAPEKTVDFSVGKDRQEAIDRLREHNGSGFTPITAVETAFRKLAAIPSNNVSDEYWLIVLTDGEFQNGQGQALPSLDLDDYFAGYRNNLMPNGTAVKVMYIAIGENIPIPEEKAEENMYVFHARKASDIKDILRECGLILSECIRAEDMQGTLIYGTENILKIQTSIPVSEITVISEGSPVIAAYLSNGENLTMSEIVSARYHDLGFGQTLSSEVTRMVSDDYIVGAVDVAFGDIIDPSKCIIYVKPAIHTEIAFIDEDGEVVDDIKELELGDFISAKLLLYRDDTNTLIDAKDVAKKSVNSFILQNASLKILNEVEGTELDAFKITNEGIVCFGSIRFGESFSVKNTRVINVYQSKYNDDLSYSFNRTRLNSSATIIRAEYYINGVRQNYDGISDYMVEYICECRALLFELKHSNDKNGYIKYWPQFGNGTVYNKVFTDWLSVWILRKDYPFKVQVTNKSIADTEVELHDTFYITLKKGNFFVELFYRIYPFFFIFVILGYTFKMRFRREDRFMYIILEEKGTELDLTSHHWHRRGLVHRKHRWLPPYTGRWSFVPFAANRKHCGPFIVKATSFLWRKGTSVKINTKGCMVFTANQEKLEKSVFRLDAIPAEVLLKEPAQQWTRLSTYQNLVIFKDDTWYLLRLYRKIRRGRRRGRR